MKKKTLKKLVRNIVEEVMDEKLNGKTKEQDAYDETAGSIIQEIRMTLNGDAEAVKSGISIEDMFFNQDEEESDWGVVVCGGNGCKFAKFCKHYIQNKSDEEIDEILDEDSYEIIEYKCIYNDYSGFEAIEE